MIEAKERFFKYVEKTDSCWNWIGGVGGGKDGEYGYFRYLNKMICSHRFSYELSKGKIKIGNQIDHLCRNKLCVNPDHLESVSQKENIMRGIGLTAINSKKTHCKRGHEFTPDNIYKTKTGKICLTCKKLSNDLRCGKAKAEAAAATLANLNKT